MDDKVFDLLEKVYSEMQAGFLKTNERLDKIENNIIKLESKIDGEVSNKIESLFDGYKQSIETTHRTEAKIDDLVTKVEGQQVEIRVIKGVK